MTPTALLDTPDTRPDALDLVDPDLYAHGDPHPLWNWLRAHDPAHWHRPGHLPGFWAITRHEDVRAVYRDHETFSSSRGILLRPASHGADPGGGRTLALTDQPRHHQMRSLVSDWFTTRSVRALEESMRGTVRAVVRRAAEQEECDFVTDVAARLPLYVICRLMGVPEEEQELLFLLTSRAFGAADAGDRSTAHQEIMQYFIDLMEQRMRAPGDDLVSALVTGEVGGELLSEEDILLNCDNLLVGGTENVRLATAGGMHAFLRQPDQWQALGRRPELMPTAVEEVLRWTSSATHIMRTATAPVMLHGKHIEAGDRVVLWLPSANRDERVFEDPFRFDVARRPNRHLALGDGRHFCIGSMLARVEMSVLFSELLAGTERIVQTAPETRLSSIVVNGLAALPVRILPKGR
jgi:cytochrome P450